MSDVRSRLRERCVAALRHYLAGGGESALHAGYEVGREALERGLGVLEVSAITLEALVELVQRDGTRAPLRTLVEAGPFLLECVSPFEMAHRGAADSNAALRRIVQVREEENRRLALELHDHASQMLAAVHLALDGVAAHVAPAGDPHLDTVRRHLRSVESQLRRISHEMRPAMLDDLGLEPALRYLCDGFAQRSGVVVSVRVTLGGRPPAAIEMALYRAAQEALNNVVRHAQATLATLRVEERDQYVSLTVRDDGVGFDPRGHTAGGSRAGLGLRGVRERVAALGGELEIRSEPGRGTELRVSVPFAEVGHAAHPAGR